MNPFLVLFLQRALTEGFKAAIRTNQTLHWAYIRELDRLAEAEKGRFSDNHGEPYDPRNRPGGDAAAQFAEEMKKFAEGNFGGWRES